MRAIYLSIPKVVVCLWLWLWLSLVPICRPLNCSPTPQHHQAVTSKELPHLDLSWREYVEEVYNQHNQSFSSEYMHASAFNDSIIIMEALSTSLCHYSHHRRIIILSYHKRYHHTCMYRSFLSDPEDQHQLLL